MDTNADAHDGKADRLALTKALFAIAACLGSAPGEANPLGPQVVNGQASFAQHGNTLAITNSPNAIINWQGFSISPGEITRFIQQNPGSSVLNRIIGQDPSQILGALQSNGRVLLINPNGVIFGPGARVDVNGLVASTLNLSNQDFLAGKLNFTAGDKIAGIQNQGTISTPSGGQVYLIAANVQNNGLIISPKGEVVLAAGHTVKLADSANPDLHVVVSANASRAINVGQIVAQGGRIGIFGALINQRGVVNANSLAVAENGKIVFKASRDTLLEAGSRTSATGAGKGGEIRVLGERVALTGDASVDASGQRGGGTVLVGGDYRGQNADVQNAAQTFVSPDARIAADAVERGDGGKVIVWSNDLTRVSGAISARGGAVSGDGGFVEVSGHTLDMRGNVDTRAPHGATGTLLLDPTNIYIAFDQASASVAGMIGSDSSASAGASPFMAAGSVGDSLLSVATLQAALASSSVIVSTANDPGTGAGVITVVDPVAWSSANSLSLNADGNVLINATITGPAGAVTLSAPTGRIFGNGLITAASLTAVATDGIGHGSPLLTQVAALSVTNTGSDTNIHISNTGALTIVAARQTFAGGVGTITVSTSESMTISGPVTSNGGSVTLDAGSSGTTANQLNVGTGGSVSSGTGDILLRAGGAITTAGTVSSASGQVTLEADQGTLVPPVVPPVGPEVPVVPVVSAEPVASVVQTVASQIKQTIVFPLTDMIGTVFVVSSPSSTQPVQVAVNVTIATVNTKEGEGTESDKPVEQTSDNKIAGNTKAEDKKEEKKEEKKVEEKKEVPKKDEVAKKMYCN